MPAQPEIQDSQDLFIGHGPHCVGGQSVITIVKPPFQTAIILLVSPRDMLFCPERASDPDLFDVIPLMTLLPFPERLESETLFVDLDPVRYEDRR